MTMTSEAILACDVFREELASLGVEEPRITWLEMGLHDQPDRLRKEISDALSELEKNPEVETILMAYGLCGNGLLGVQAGRCPLVLPRAHDCISILLGGVNPHQAILKETPGTYFYSPGWIREKRVPGPDRDAYLKALYGERYGDDEEMIEDLIEADHDTFAHHECAAYVDLTDNREAEGYARTCADCLGWKFRRLQGDPSMLRALLHGPRECERFLTVPPGQKIGLEGGQLVAMPAGE